MIIKQRLNKSYSMVTESAYNNAVDIIAERTGQSHDYVEQWTDIIAASIYNSTVAEDKQLYLTGFEPLVWFFDGDNEIIISVNTDEIFEFES